LSIHGCRFNTLLTSLVFLLRFRHTLIGLDMCDVDWINGPEDRLGEHTMPIARQSAGVTQFCMTSLPYLEVFNATRMPRPHIAAWLLESGSMQRLRLMHVDPDSAADFSTFHTLFREQTTLSELVITIPRVRGRDSAEQDLRKRASIYYDTFSFTDHYTVVSMNATDLTNLAQLQRLRICAPDLAFDVTWIISTLSVPSGVREIVIGVNHNDRKWKSVLTDLDTLLSEQYFPNLKLFALPEFAFVTETTLQEIMPFVSKRGVFQQIPKDYLL
jgi:hypothetical protein